MRDHAVASRSAQPSPVTRALHALLRRGRTLYGAMGLLLVVGLGLAMVALWGFAELAEGVLDGETRSFDQGVLRWIDAHAPAWIDVVALEITSLGETLVLGVIATIAALLLRMAGDRIAAWVMAAAFGGGVVLNTVLKLVFARERPEIFSVPGGSVSTFSFPSGHAMLSMITYATLAWLVVAHRPNRPTRRLVPLFSAALILLIGLSRMFLGVHYPSDVLAGFAVGFAWATFCAATVRAIHTVRSDG